MTNDLQQEKLRPPQKGLGRFRFRNEEEEVAAAAVSVRRWWWEYLRLSKDYWMVCKTTRPYSPAKTKDEVLAKIYRDFGDIYSEPFQEWWLRRGARVFQEQKGPPKVVEVPRNPKERLQHRYEMDRVWLDIPLKLSRATIMRQVSAFLAKHEDQRVCNRLELSESNYRINPVRFRLHTLQQMHAVHCLHRELIEKPAALNNLGIQMGTYQHRADLFRIGKLLHVSPSNESLTGDPEDIRLKQNRMRATVGRLLTRSRLLITNVEQGEFPKFSPVSRTTERFEQWHLDAHKELEAEWWSLDLSSTLNTKRVEDALRIYYAE